MNVHKTQRLERMDSMKLKRINNTTKSYWKQILELREEIKKKPLMDDIQFFNMDFWFQIIVMININIGSSERQKKNWETILKNSANRGNIYTESYIIWPVGLSKENPKHQKNHLGKNGTKNEIKIKHKKMTNSESETKAERERMREKRFADRRCWKCWNWLILLHVLNALSCFYKTNSVIQTLGNTCTESIAMDLYACWM